MIDQDSWAHLENILANPGLTQPSRNRMKNKLLIRVLVYRNRTPSPTVTSLGIAVKVERFSMCRSSHDSRSVTASDVYRSESNVKVAHPAVRARCAGLFFRVRAYKRRGWARQVRDAV